MLGCFGSLKDTPKNTHKNCSKSGCLSVSIQALLDERDISRKLSDFARILDTKRWGDLEQVFSSDVAFDYGTGEEKKGIEALRLNMTRFLEVCGQSQHLIGSILVEVDGDKGNSRAYVQARHQGAQTSGGAIFDTNGEYIDSWERGEQGWRIVRRDVNWSTFYGDPSIIYGAE